MYDIPDPSKVLIVDCSRWQDDPNTENLIDFEIMKYKGVKGVILKAGQGLYHDRVVNISWEHAKEAGLPVGLYWYLDNTVDPKLQAKKFLELDLMKAELGIWVDLEHRANGRFMGWKNWYNFIATLQEKLPTLRIGIYTGHYYWIEFTKGSGISLPSLGWFKQFPLWIASYGLNPLYTEPWGDNWTIWQFTDFLDGESYGAESKELDGNYFRGTLDEYKQFFKLDNIEVPTEEPTPEENPKMPATHDCVTRFEVKVRPTPDTSNVATQKMPPLTRFQISEIVPDRLDPSNSAKKWGKIFGGQFDGLYTALEYPGNSNPLSTYIPITVTPPPTGGEVVLTHTIEVYSDGSIKVDGNPV